MKKSIFCCKRFLYRLRIKTTTSTAATTTNKGGTQYSSKGKNTSSDRTIDK
ncbi:MAG: hypothetical protein IKS00_06435 [Bacteroidales bacterium]|nr:hypothetical protein [Bacteroidales bacterium]